MKSNICITMFKLSIISIYIYTLIVSKRIVGGSLLYVVLLVIGGKMRRDLNTCSSQSAMHHGVPVSVFFRRSSEHHIRNDSSSSTSWSHDSHVFPQSRTLVVPGTFLRVLYNNIHHHVAFARELEEKEKNTEQD